MQLLNYERITPAHRCNVIEQMKIVCDHKQRFLNDSDEKEKLFVIKLLNDKTMLVKLVKRI